VTRSRQFVHTSRSPALAVPQGTLQCAGPCDADPGRQQTPDLDFNDSARLRAQDGPCLHLITPQLPSSAIPAPKLTPQHYYCLVCSRHDSGLHKTPFCTRLTPVGCTLVDWAAGLQAPACLCYTAATPSPAVSTWVACTCLDCPLQHPP
jgi:hypothetical protein